MLHTGDEELGMENANAETSTAESGQQHTESETTMNTNTAGFYITLIDETVPSNGIITLTVSSKDDYDLLHKVYLSENTDKFTDAELELNKLLTELYNENIFLEVRMEQPEQLSEETDGTPVTMLEKIKRHVIDNKWIYGAVTVLGIIALVVSNKEEMDIFITETPVPEVNIDVELSVIETTDE